MRYLCSETVLLSARTFITLAPRSPSYPSKHHTTTKNQLTGENQSFPSPQPPSPAGARHYQQHPQCQVPQLDNHSLEPPSFVD